MGIIAPFFIKTQKIMQVEIQPVLICKSIRNTEKLKNFKFVLAKKFEAEVFRNFMTNTIDYYGFRELKKRLQYFYENVIYSKDFFENLEDYNNYKSCCNNNYQHEIEIDYSKMELVEDSGLIYKTVKYDIPEYVKKSGNMYLQKISLYGLSEQQILLVSEEPFGLYEGARVNLEFYGRPLIKVYQGFYFMSKSGIQTFKLDNNGSCYLVESTTLFSEKIHIPITNKNIYYYGEQYSNNLVRTHCVLNKDTIGHFYPIIV